MLRVMLIEQSLERATAAEVIVCDIDDPSRDATWSMPDLQRDENGRPRANSPPITPHGVPSHDPDHSPATAPRRRHRRPARRVADGFLR